ncbi:MAG: hypothetical protein II131_02475 [Neisseriaceae bacterium]|nr:hypothetical protein [Neisseriaceae bacterium]
MKKSFYLSLLCLLVACSSNDITLQNQTYKLDVAEFGKGYMNLAYTNKKNPNEKFLVMRDPLPQNDIPRFSDLWIEDQQKKRQKAVPICTIEKKHYQNIDYYVCDSEQNNVTVVYVLETKIIDGISYGFAKIRSNQRRLSESEQQNIAIGLSQFSPKF